jgi:type II secretory pathway pseudopilin PulG
MNDSVDTAIDARNPWLGLASFTEETSDYFFGRDEEIAELARRVQRKLLTVLFGQSGLGKTSILRAGLVPRLRSQGYCPVYVRIDYAAEAPEPAEQIKQAIAQTARGSGEWTRAGVAAVGESLWEFLHHRDDVLKDETGQTLTPFLIFDQFEEIFTLAQNDDAGKARAARFIQDLADLVENRPPHEFEARLENDDSAAEMFDFGRSDYRVLIALREDYLAPLESLKRAMPSIAQNRLRLAPMTGQQALAAVLKPGKGLVEEEVAGAIVRFVAGGAEIQNAEVEPALLSLVCRELNDARLAANRREISADLLEGSQDSILGNFYERSLADQPASVRRIIEDQLLTASGFRENIAEERLLAAFKSAGIPPETLAVLVNRRLLRVEDRLDLRRVELTHDVLCSVVKTSRDLRQEREAREASGRQLAEQRDKEAAARKALVRARQVAGVCALLAIVAVAAAGFAVYSTQRAKRAESATQQARVQAEGLVGYLSADFATELETYGQLSTISEIAHRQIDYFRGLPASLKGIESTRNGALAMIAFSRAEAMQGRPQQADAPAREAIALLETARAHGDTSEATTIALARAYGVRARILGQDADSSGLETAKKAAQLVAPVASGANASRAARKAYADILTALGFEQFQFHKEWEQGVENLQHARNLAAALGGRQVQTPEMGVLYADAGCWEAEILIKLEREAEAKTIDLEADHILRKVLEARPYYRRAIHIGQIVDLDLANIAAIHLDPAAAFIDAERAWQLAQAELNLDPDNSSAINNAAVNLLSQGDLAWALGRVSESFDFYRRTMKIGDRVQQSGTWFVLNSLTPQGTLGMRLADSGADDAARAVATWARNQVEGLKKSEPAGSHVPLFAECAQLIIESQVAMGLGDFKTAATQAAAAAQLVQNVEPDAAFEGFLKFNCVVYGPVTQGEADFWLGNYAAAERGISAAIEARTKYPSGTLDEQRSAAYARTLKALTLLRMGHATEARALIEPTVQFERGLAKENRGDVTQYLELAQTLYVESLTDLKRQASLQREALTLIDALPSEFAKLHSTIRWRNLISRPSHTPLKLSG